jgi:nanoRNase/pAp phosphatase (c-di-AMP/oligoRNAs hydrolase)
MRFSAQLTWPSRHSQVEANDRALIVLCDAVEMVALPHVNRRKINSNRRKLEKLRGVLDSGKSMLIVLQDFPDPDAVAAAAALKEIACGISTSIACGGVVGRAENRALVRYMGMNLLSAQRIDMAGYDLIAMVDTQPGAGNNALESSLLPHIVIDHHPIQRKTRQCRFFDIRSRYGSTSTILYEYLEAAGVEISIPLATALVDGIRSDTDDFGRETSQADIDATHAMYPRANKRMLGRMQMEQLPRDYFKILYDGLKNAKTCGHAIMSRLGEIANPDMIGEVADLLLRNDESTWALCYGTHNGRMLISIRTMDLDADAGKVMRRIVSGHGTGGGHNAMAGGQLGIEGLDERALRRLERTIQHRFLRRVGCADTRFDQLVSDAGTA